MKRPCPICKKSVDWKTNPFGPFCSERCRVTDLGNWALEKYRIKAEDKTEDKTQDKTEEPPASEPADAEIHHG